MTCDCDIEGINKTFMRGEGVGCRIKTMKNCEG